MAWAVYCSRFIEAADSYAHACIHMFLHHGVHCVKDLQAEQLVHSLWLAGLPVTEC